MLCLRAIQLSVSATVEYPPEISFFYLVLCAVEVQYLTVLAAFLVLSPGNLTQYVCYLRAACCFSIPCHTWLMVLLRRGEARYIPCRRTKIT